MAWGLFLLPLDAWSISLTVMALTFIVETSVVRHYAFAAVFITPLTILLADAAAVRHGSPRALMVARLLDTVLGCVVGLAGGVALHSPRFREWFGRPMRTLIPRRIGQRW